MTAILLIAITVILLCCFFIKRRSRRLHVGQLEVIEKSGDFMTDDYHAVMLDRNTGQMWEYGDDGLKPMEKKGRC